MSEDPTLYHGPTVPPPTPPKSRRTLWIVLGSVGGVIVACCVILAIIGAIVGPPKTPASSNNNNQAAVVHATATHAPKAKATATPRPKPTATPSLLDQVTRIAHDAAGDDSSHAQVDLTFYVVTVTLTVGQQFDVPSLQTTCKMDIFDEMKAFFTSRLHIDQVNITINGPVTDQYGNSTTGLYAYADLNYTTAQLFNWGNLDYNTAWADYDSHFVRSS